MSDDYRVVPDAQRRDMRLLEQEAEHLRGRLVGAAWTNKSFTNNHHFAAQVDISDCQSNSVELAKRTEELIIKELGADANVKLVLVDERTEDTTLHRVEWRATISFSADH